MELLIHLNQSVGAITSLTVFENPREFRSIILPTQTENRANEIEEFVSKMTKQQNYD